MPINPKRLAELRVQQRYSQATLAKAAGVTESFITGIETGASQDPGHSRIAKVARVLGKDPDYFFDDEPQNVEDAPTDQPA